MGSLLAQSQTDSLKQIRADSVKKAMLVRQVQFSIDSARKAEVAKQHYADSAAKAKEEIRRIQVFAEVQRVLRQHPVYSFGGKPVLLTIEIRKASSNEGLFYFIFGLILYFALIRLFFYKYLGALFTLFFRAPLRQQQLREQLLQSPLPALLMNIFFVVNAGVYCAFLATHYRFSFAGNFWSTALSSIVIIALIYTSKYILLKIAGWIFGIRAVSDTYIFVVFLINKMIGVFLLPVLVAMAFPDPLVFPVALVLSYLLIICLFLYRFIISYRAVRNEIKLNGLHFFLYLCAFEIAPLLLIYKVLLSFLISSY
ncbi:MAG: DUF4271 domain-containing protein [Flavitalea sp.]